MKHILFSAFTWLLVLTFTFSGLLVWPLYRRVWPLHPKRLGWLKTIFRLHIAFGSLSIAYVAYAILTDQPDAHMTATFVYLVGTMSLIASCSVSVIGALTARFRK
jgi:hypothetical protein